MANRVLTVETAAGFQDSLDGSVLHSGERIYVRWPSGFTQPVEVQIDIVPLGVLRDGVVVTVPCSKAYFRVATSGSLAKLYLNGLTAQRAR